MAETTMDQGNGRRPNVWRLTVWGGAAGLLLLPLVAMQLHAPGVNWTGSDFVVMGAMLATACGLWELGLRLSRNRAYRAAVALAVVAGFLMTWMNLAVGIIGNEDNPLNLLFFAVLAIGMLGAPLARFRPLGMAGAMLAMAGAQAMVAVATLIVGEMTFVISGFFTAVWLASAALFAKAARDGKGSRG
jgi:hypothetical protein